MKKTFLWYLGLVIVAVGVGGTWAYATQRSSDPFVSQSLPELPVPPLRELAEQRGIEVGSFASLKYLRERPYSEILATEFDYAIIDGEPNWKFEDFSLRPTPDTFDFSHMDQVFEFADQNDMPVRVQHLLWGDEKWLPDWLTQQPHTEAELRGFIQNHIATVGAHFAGSVREYTVVNEAFSRELEIGGNKDWWGERLGHGYIDLAFLEAKKADPHAILILNDFGNETIGDVSNNMYSYIKDARTRGVPIDAIGMQMHIDSTNAPSKEKVVENMRRFSDLGIKIYITEFDVNMHGFSGSEDAQDQRQAEIYKDMIGACLEVGASACPNFGFLGLVDRQSWYNGLGIHDAAPLMFKDDYTPKPAFFAVRDALQKR